MTSSARGEAAGAAAGAVTQVPTWPGTSQLFPAPTHAVSQHTSSLQNRPVAHCAASVQAPPCATGVAVGVVVVVAVAVAVAVGVDGVPMRTVKVQALVLFAISTQVHVTGVRPTAKVPPGGGTQANDWTPPASEQDAT